jgi:hypothetical protein
LWTKKGCKVYQIIEDEIDQETGAVSAHLCQYEKMSGVELWAIIDGEPTEPDAIPVLS